MIEVESEEQEVREEVSEGEREGAQSSTKSPLPPCLDWTDLLLVCDLLLHSVDLLGLLVRLKAN